ncbi:MAG: aminoacetone oxidase family FAD-binding enzyme, partial [Clostridia bacterium]|nr:aminoacetone oxidase family FAD-binding enzyme [Clostridia bacterium]
MYDILIVGGGAAGMMAAIASKHTAPQLSVAIVERCGRVGRKILTTGNGRCNMTNTNISIDRYHGENAKFAMGALSKIDKDTTLDIFLQMGILPKTEDDKIYPYSLQASSIVDVMRLELARYGVNEICDFHCTSLKHKEDVFTLMSADGKAITARRVIVCVGGSAAPKMGTDGTSYKLLQTFGHQLTALYPSLVQVKCDPKDVMPMKGVKVDANLSVYVNNKFVSQNFGELLFTDYGLSGPVVFQLSRIASVHTCCGDRVDMIADIMPDMTEEELYYHMCMRSKDVPVEEFLTGVVNKLVGRVLLKKCGVERFNTSAQIIDDNMLKSLAHLMKSWKFTITGTNSWQQAQVTAGGIKTDDFNPSTMESAKVKGLYAAGEVLDIDGDCGG